MPHTTKGTDLAPVPFLYNVGMHKWILLLCPLVLAACASHTRHMNEVFAHYVEKVHVACNADADCVAVYKSCRYPEWGYAAINRRELADFNRVREADWYTRCKDTPDTSHIKAICRQNRCVLADEAK